MISSEDGGCQMIQSEEVTEASIVYLSDILKHKCLILIEFQFFCEWLGLRTGKVTSGF